MKLQIGGNFHHIETGTVMVLVSGDTILDEYELKERIDGGGFLLAWKGNSSQLEQDFVYIKNKGEELWTE